ncbi:MAG: hypothetical protein OEN02_09045 [Gammaproteobacteria bacterium]|nr:hypothetical protein [Gammaproteobacteria bacterium]MDH3536622.1 hypothetical protein [Gammaproteobacteria bacterium]
MNRYRRIALLLLVLSANAGAHHDSGADWSWHVVSAGLDESRVAIYRQRDLVGIFDFSCDLTNALESGVPGNGASLEVVKPASNPDGLLIVTCNVGAHSQYLAVVDPKHKSGQPAFARTGSYFVKWELADGELWISFDEPCAEGVGVECPDGFETIFVQYSEEPQDSKAN